MRITKKLNNNTVVTVDDKGNEVIFTGLGIAWDRKVGDEVDESKVEKSLLLKMMKSEGNYKKY